MAVPMLIVVMQWNDSADKPIVQRREKRGKVWAYPMQGSAHFS